jgi:hypothetical protein
MQFWGRRNLTWEWRLRALVASLGSRSGRRRWSQVFAALTSDVSFLCNLLKVRPTLFNQPQILVLDHGMCFCTHVVGNG